MGESEWLRLAWNPHRPREISRPAPLGIVTDTNWSIRPTNASCGG